MKSAVLLMSLLLPSSVVLSANDYHRRISRLDCIMTNVHTHTFSVPNLFGAPLKTQAWRDAVTAIEQELEPSSTEQHNKNLMKNYNIIKKADNNLIRTINDAYVHLFISQKPNDECSKIFGNIHSDMIQLSNCFKTNMKNDGAKETPFQKQQAIGRVLLYRLALSIAATAKKAQNDLRTHNH